MVANKIALSTKETLWSYKFHFLCKYCQQKCIGPNFFSYNVPGGLNNSFIVGLIKISGFYFRFAITLTFSIFYMEAQKLKLETTERFLWKFPIYTIYEIKFSHMYSHPQSNTAQRACITKTWIKNAYLIIHCPSFWCSLLVCL